MNDGNVYRPVEKQNATVSTSFQSVKMMILWEKEHQTSRSIKTSSDTITIGPFVIQTTLLGSSGNNGAMFDITSPPGGQDVEIISMDVHVAVVKSSCWIEIYGKSGSHVGLETTPSAWSLLVNTTIQCQGFGVDSHVPQTAFLQAPHIRGNSSYALYVRIPNGELRYDTGTKLGAVASSSQYLAIHSGTGLGGQFNQTFPGRVWNGAITFNVTKPKSEGLPDPPANPGGVVCSDNITTSYNDNIGSYGQMFNIQTFGSMIEVVGVDFYTDLLQPVTYELYSRIGTFVEGSSLSQWVFLQGGTINGFGAGKGTPIRGFAPFVVNPFSVQGFYVTLTTPDLRYQLLKNSGPTDLKVGDFYIHNDDVAIQLGASVGTYPLANTFFGPQLYSGAIIYNTFSTCRTPAPTMAPSQIATFAPTTIETLAPTPSGTYVAECTTSDSLETTLEGTTRAYGFMFTVEPKNETISVTSLELLIGGTDTIGVTVYSKPGDYKGFESSSDAWKQVAKTQVQGTGKKQGAVIPTQNFEPVIVYAGHTHAFYVTLSVPNLIYSVAKGAVGTEVASNDYLIINAGAGLIDKTFGSKMYEPRLFNRAVMFRLSTDCFTKTVISFGFNIQYNPSMKIQKVYDSIARMAGNAIHALVDSAPDLQQLKTTNNLAYNSTDVFPSSRPGGSDLCRDLTEDWNCVPVDVNATFRHRITLDEGKLILDMLNYASNVTSALNVDETKMIATYAGNKGTSATVRISLVGSLDSEMGENEQDYFKTVTLDYLQQKVSGKATVVGVQIVNQKLNKGGGGTSLGRFLQRSSSSLDVTTTVTGEYTPPTDPQLGQSTSDAINNDGGKTYTQDIQDSTRDKPEWMQNKAYFQKVTGASSQDLSNKPKAAPSSGGISSGAIIGIIVVVAVVFLGTVYYFCFCRKRSKGGAEFDNDGMPMPINSSILKYDEKIMDADCFYADSQQMYKDVNNKQMAYGNYDNVGIGQNAIYPSKGGDPYDGSFSNIGMGPNAVYPSKGGDPYGGSSYNNINMGPGAIYPSKGGDLYGGSFSNIDMGQNAVYPPMGGDPYGGMPMNDNVNSNHYSYTLT